MNNLSAVISQALQAHSIVTANICSEMYKYYSKQQDFHIYLLVANLHHCSTLFCYALISITLNDEVVTSSKNYAFKIILPE